MYPSAVRVGFLVLTLVEGMTPSMASSPVLLRSCTRHVSDILQSDALLLEQLQIDTSVRQWMTRKEGLVYHETP